MMLIKMEKMVNPQGMIGRMEKILRTELKNNL